ncbi:hypothetical protein [Spirosoma gilvum]
MKKIILILALLSIYSPVFADIPGSGRHGSPNSSIVSDSTLLIGVLTVVVLFIVWRIRKRGEM